MCENREANRFLSNEEEYLFEELKLIQKIMSESESMYGKWENWFFAAENILVLAAVQLIVKSSFSIIAFFIGILGIVLSIQFLLVQKGNHIYATARLNRWEELEKLLSKPLTGKSGKFMKILSSQDDEKLEHKWYDWPLTTWCIRKSLPFIFLIFWAIFIVALLLPGLIQTLGDFKKVVMS